MMTKQEVLTTLENFQDESGASFNYAEPDAMSIIEDALDLFYAVKYRNLEKWLDKHIQKFQ